MLATIYTGPSNTLIVTWNLKRELRGNLKGYNNILLGLLAPAQALDEFLQDSVFENGEDLP
jgi:hypothetical protein